MAVRDQAKTAKKRVTLLQNYKITFSDGPGRKVLLDLMTTHHIMGPVFTENARETILREGERNVVLRILKILGIDTNEMLKNIEEAQREQEE